MKTIEMKRTLSILCLLSFSLFMNGQQATGYTKTRNYTAERIYMDASSQTGSGGARIVSDIVYTDCFGRKEQEIQVGGSPGGNADLVLSYTYNMMGQVEKEYLPYAKTGNNGAFDKFSPERWSVYGTGEQAYAYNLTQYEDSPLMRVSRKMGPGKAWHTSDKSVRVTYGMNSTNEVRCYKVSSSGSLIASGFYGAGKLEVIVETDEDGHRSKTYTDSNERTLLTVSVNGEDSLATYYVYDDRNCLRYVLPPEASHRLAEAGTTDISVLHSLAYSYEYDKLNRMISKRLPGCAPIYMVYDRGDRLVLSQDGTRRTADTKKWSYFLYDSHDRVIESGEILLSAEQTCGELQLAAWESEHYLPSGTRTPLQYTVYDNYKPTENVTAHPFVAAVGYDTPYTLYPSGLTTSTKTRLLGTDDWLTETIYYDDRSRVIQTLCHYPEKGLRYRHTAYDFTGNVLRKQDNIGTDILETVYTYDDRARLLTKANTWNGRFTDKITYVYDALGRLTGRNYGDKVSESLSYNIRGWLTGIESQHFSQTLHYVDGVGVPCYNGNISSMIWHSGSEAGLRGYKFTYDGFSRLKDAIYGEGEQLSNNLNRFNEQVTGYDKNGNILGLLRYGQTNTMSYGLIDNLNLVYNGNQLESVNDNATGHVFGNGMEFKDGASKEIEYEYDANGNLTKDLNKKIADIQYNCLNLPEKVQFEGGNSISYLYAADGTKLRTTYKTGNATIITDYCGNAIYENGVLIKVLTEDGYITVLNNQFHYFIQDHQGNNRVVVAQNGTVEEVNDYYPFGGLLSSSLSNNVQPYKYNGKELNRDNGLDWYDYGARMYDASLGRWHVVDPMSEKYYSISSYVYGLNTPHNCIDPDGQKIIFVNGYLGFGSPRGGGTYWGGVNSSFVKGAKNFFNDQSAYFTDFDFNYLRSSTFLRNLDGYAYAKENYKQLIMGMNPQEDVFRIISHSMGGAFSEGIIRYLKEQGWNVDFSIHLNTWLPSELMGSVGTFLIDATITNDWVQGLSLPIDGSRDIPNANYKIRKKSNEGYQYRHRDWIDSGSFWNANNGITWNQLMPILDSWLIQNPNIQINYGQ